MQLNRTKIVFEKKGHFILIGWLPILFYLANLYRMTGHSSSLYLISLFVIGIIGLIILFFKRKIQRNILLFTLGIYLFTGIINLLVIRNVDYIDLIVDMLLFGIMIVMLAYPITYLQGSIGFYVSAAVFFYGYISNANTIIFLTSSRNYISILLILAVSLYYIAVQNTDRTIKLIDLFPALICFFLSIWATGRGGILSSFILFSLLTLYYIKNYVKQNLKRYGFLILIILCILIYLIINDINPLEKFMDLGKWSSKGSDNTARELIWSSYFEKLGENIIYIFTGAPLDQIPIIHAYGNNLHNSFLQLHANNGLIMFILFFVLLIKTLIYLMRNKKTLMVIVILTILARGMTDKFIFGQYGMPIMMYLILYPYAGQNVNKYSSSVNEI